MPKKMYRNNAACKETPVCSAGDESECVDECGVEINPPCCDKTFCNMSTMPETEEGQALLALFDEICPNWDPDFEPPAPESKTPICVKSDGSPACLPANPVLLTIFEDIADILEK